MKHLFYIFLIVSFISACDRVRWREGERLMDRGKAFMLDGQRDSAFVCFSLVADQYAENMCDSDKRMVAFALNNCGYISLFFYSNYSQSYSYLIRAKDLCERNGIVSAMPIVMQNLGNLYAACGSQMGDRRSLRTATAYYRKSVDASAAVCDWDILLSSYINLVSLSCKLRQDFRAVADSIRIPMAKIPDSAVKRYVLQMDSALRSAAAGRYKAARQMLDRQFETVRSLDNADQYDYITYAMKVESFRQERLYDSVAVCLSEALSLARRNGNIETQTDVYREWESVCREKGDTIAADVFHNRYLDSKDSLLYRSHLASVNEMHLSHEVKEASQKIKQIDTQRRIQTVVIAAITAVVIITFCLLYIIYRRNRELDERNRTLYDRNVELLKREEDMKKMRSHIENANAGASRRSNDVALDEDKQTALSRKIQAVLDDLPTITSAAFNLSRLAELVGSNTTYVSRVVNDVYGKNLSMLLSDLRIKEACRRINDPEKYGQFTLETISASVGFKSRSTFLTAFKRVTGLLPSEYLKIANGRRTDA